MEKFLTIILNAGYVDRLKIFLDNISETCNNAKHFEVCVMINEGNNKLENSILQFQKEYSFEIKYAKTTNTYEQGNINCNHAIFKISDQSTYFIQMLSDRYRFANKDWDLFLKKYIGLVSDDIFFLRTAKYSQNLKPRQSVYEAFCANETWGFYTRKLLEATGGFPETIPSHDCGFEMLYYYIKLNTPHDPFVRDISVPFLDDTKVTQSIDSGPKRSLFYYRSSMFYLGRCGFLSRKTIENLICQSKRFSLQLLINHNNLNGKIIQNEKKKYIAIQVNDKITNKVFYRASYAEIIKAKLEARLNTNHPQAFFVDLFLIMQFETGRKFIKLLLEKADKKKNNNKNFIKKIFSSKKFANITLRFLCKIFFIAIPNCKECLTLLSDQDFTDGVLQNNEFKRQFKSYYKFFGCFIKTP